MCPECRQRKARRACPALGREICSVCCGTKRLTEIACPEDCVYLAASREHPAAVVRRQQERDVATLLPTLRLLNERQHQLFFLFHSAIARHTPDGFLRLVDADVAHAASALAATLETVTRGVIYEHQPESLPAKRLMADLKSLLDRIREQGGRVFDAEAALVLRAIEKGARDAQLRGDGETAYLAVMGRLLQQPRTAELPEEPATKSLIVP